MSELPWGKKGLGQHWLNDWASLEAMSDAADLQKGDTVLEIGPGTGTLTELLLEKGASVIAVEKDRSLLVALVKKFSSKNFILHNEGILEFDLTQLPASYKIVANIPYYLTSNLIRTLSESSNPPQTAVLLVQKEVAERVAAGPGKMSLLSVTAQLYWDVSLGLKVPAKLFSPPPKVDSQILILKRRTEPLFPNADTKQLFRIVKAGFGERRKTLGNSLSGALRISKDEAREILRKAEIDPGLRAQALSLENWHQLYKQVNT